ncbi:Lon-like protease with PDZ domain [Alloactinosynnema sp. L-07]|uniref:YlbL family protein n=1 Tax=Alloactinosynnema sp. L-07 TaxID=1653480 RepID=UPI00065EF618|nr:S16 family serine protease [Alloactinosynnema sp. L-07]CRK61906.1 Lon-like protease with PDZ domain [Alloactinosynnema sp. L-07]
MSTSPDAPVAPSPAPPWELSRRGWTVLISSLLVTALMVIGLFVPVPYVSLGPGPTYDTLGAVDDTPIIHIEGAQTYPTTGQLRMTTVSVKDDVSMFEAVALWVSGRYALAPREEYFRPGVTEEEVEEQNSKLFQDSQTNAEIAALRELKYPVKVIAQRITSGAPADKVLVPGDRLVEVNGKKIANAEDVRAALAGTAPGASIPITFKREGVDKSGTIVLGKATDFGAEDRPEGFMGLESAERPDVPFKTTISLADVGGPSAGLMFALAIIDRLTPGDLGGGEIVAGTGEITAQGEVDPIGGIPFKMVSAKEAGATTFLVPVDNCAEAKENAPDGLRLIKVENLAGAVKALEGLKDNRDLPTC